MPMFHLPCHNTNRLFYNDLQFTPRRPSSGWLEDSVLGSGQKTVVIYVIAQPGALQPAAKSCGEQETERRFRVLDLAALDHLKCLLKRYAFDFHKLVRLRTCLTSRDARG